MQEIPYVGNELELFEKAYNWKKYYGNFLKPFLKGKVLEVGAGLGGTTNILCNGNEDKWLCLEPDRNLFNKLQERIQKHELPLCCTALNGTIQDLPGKEKYNAIIYIDVIEHIEKDNEELLRAKSYLEHGGYLIVLVPAHQYLFNRFDKAIGHYRRYNKEMLLNAAPKDLKLVKIKYLDSVGLVASILNKYILKQDYPTSTQISFWNKCIIPISKVTDILFNYNLGKTLFGIWENK